MADPVQKVKHEQLKAIYDELLSRLSSIQQELFKLGIEIETTRQKLAEDGTLPKSFNDKVISAKFGMKKDIFGGPIKMRGFGITGIVPHPVDAPATIDSEGSWGE